MNLCIYIQLYYILVQLFMWMGLPQVITSDQGTEFNNKLDKKTMALLGINII